MATKSSQQRERAKVQVQVHSKSRVPLQRLVHLTDFVSSQFPDLEWPVHVFFTRRWASAAGGTGHWPSHTEQIVLGDWKLPPRHYGCDIYTPDQPDFPRELVYKKQAGPAIYANITENLVHTIAHELRHLEQMEMFRKSEYYVDLSDNFGWTFYDWAHNHAGFKGRSCEVDAELVAHRILDEFRLYKNGGAIK